MEIIKLFDGVYEISPALEPFKLEFKDEYHAKIAPERRKLMGFLCDMKFTNFNSCCWGPNSYDYDGSGQRKYHIDGAFLKDDDTTITLELYDYMLMCILSNHPKQGTYLEIPNQRKKYLTKPWTPYLIRGDIKHRGRPKGHKIRACLRWYFKSEGKLS